MSRKFEEYRQVVVSRLSALISIIALVVRCLRPVSNRLEMLVLNVR